MEGTEMTIVMIAEGHTGLGVAVPDVLDPEADPRGIVVGAREKDDPTHALGAGVSLMAGGTGRTGIVMDQEVVPGVPAQLRSEQSADLNGTNEKHQTRTDWIYLLI